MKLNSTQIDVPQVFQDLFPYNFSQICIQSDFALGMGHTVAINFSVPSLKGVDTPPETFQILGIPNYDGHCIQNVDDLTESIQNICDAEIKVMNDFDIAWVTQQRVKFPKVPKRKIKQ